MIHLILIVAVLSTMIVVLRLIPVNLEKKKRRLERMIKQVDEGIVSIENSINQIKELNIILQSQNTSRSLDLKVDNLVTIGKLQAEIVKAMQLKNEIHSDLLDIHIKIMSKIK